MKVTNRALASGFLFVLLGASAGAACGGGSPASPASTPADDAAVDDASVDAGVDASPVDAGPDVFAGCGTSPDAGSIPADVTAVLVAKCQTCHQDPPLNGAPFPLVTYANVHAPFETMPFPIYQKMHAVIQPDGSPHMPYLTAPALTAAEFATLDTWLLSCAPPGD